MLKEAHTSTNISNIKLNENNFKRFSNYNDESGNQSLKSSFNDNNLNFKITHQQIYGTTIYIGDMDVDMVNTNLLK